MTRGELFALAKQAGGLFDGSDWRLACDFADENLARFVALVAAKEREACAQVCDSKYHQFIGPSFGEVRYGIAACAAAIRARGAA